MPVDFKHNLVSQTVSITLPVLLPMNTLLDYTARHLSLRRMEQLLALAGANKGMIVTRAATGVLVDITNCSSQKGILLEWNSSGRSSIIIEITDIHTLSFKLKNYTAKETCKVAYLEDIGHNCIVVPRNMLRALDQFISVQATPPPDPLSSSRS